MPWEVSLHAEAGYIETVYAGELMPADLLAAVNETLQLVNTTGLYRLLGDCSQLLGGHSPADLFYLAEALQRHHCGRQFREAVLLPRRSAAQPDARFWEDTATNHGMDVRLFDDRDTALAWLLAPGRMDVAPA
jgi:hypothetical protein